jgi:hypothetical protein
MKQWSVSKAEMDPRLSVAPLKGDVMRALAAELIRDGFGNACGECEKNFSVARKWRGVGRCTHFDPHQGRIYSTAWLLCGPCTATMRTNGNRVSNKLIAEARSAVQSAQLLLAPTGGNA